MKNNEYALKIQFTMDYDEFIAGVKALDKIAARDYNLIRLRDALMHTAAQVRVKTPTV